MKKALVFMLTLALTASLAACKKAPEATATPAPTASAEPTVEPTTEPTTEPTAETSGIDWTQGMLSNVPTFKTTGEVEEWSSDEMIGNVTIFGATQEELDAYVTSLIEAGFSGKMEAMADVKMSQGEFKSESFVANITFTTEDEPSEFLLTVSAA